MRIAPAPDYVAVGQVSADRQADGSARLGGTVAYAARAAARLGWRAGVVTRAAPGFVDPDRLPGVELRLREDRQTTTFSNRYDARGHREQWLHALAGPIESRDIPATWRRPRILHLAPVAGELGPEVLEGTKAELLGVTPQGWLRELAPGRRVRPAAWRVPARVLERADAVVLSEEDIAAVDGGAPRLRELVGGTCVLVLTRGDRGATAYLPAGGLIEQVALPVNVVDPTGAGDVFAAAFFIRLWETRDAAIALRFAAAAAALSITAKGVDGFAGRDAVAALLEQWAGA